MELGQVFGARTPRVGYAVRFDLRKRVVSLRLISPRLTYVAYRLVNDVVKDSTLYPS